MLAGSGMWPVLELDAGSIKGGTDSVCHDEGGLSRLEAWRDEHTEHWAVLLHGVCHHKIVIHQIEVSIRRWVKSRILVMTGI